VRNTAYVPGEPCAPDRQNGTWIVQAHEWGKYVGRADFELRGAEFKLLKYELIPINLKRRLADGTRVNFTAPIAEDAGLRSFLQPFQDKGQVGLNVAVGQTVGLFDGDRQRVRQQPNALGRLVAQAMADKVGADLAVMNSGGLRDSLPEGAVTYRDVLKVQPFGNQLAVVRLNGAELLTWLQGLARMTPGAGAFPQTWGLQMVIEGGVLVQARVQDQPIDPLREYRLGISNFTASGGDGYPVLDKHPGYVNTGFVDAEVLREYIARRSPIKVADFAPGNEVQRR
jgi:5'-nucleotidase/UDP-sugar diphosphatase